MVQRGSLALGCSLVGAVDWSSRGPSGDGAGKAGAASPEASPWTQPRDHRPSGALEGMVAGQPCAAASLLAAPPWCPAGGRKSCEPVPALHSHSVCLPSRDSPGGGQFVRSRWQHRSGVPAAHSGKDAGLGWQWTVLLSWRLLLLFFSPPPQAVKRFLCFSAGWQQG